MSVVNGDDDDDDGDDGLLQLDELVKVGQYRGLDEDRLSKLAIFGRERWVGAVGSTPTMRVELIGHFKSCTTEIYLHI